MSELKNKAKDFILESTVPDDLLSIVEFFDDEFTEEQFLELYDLILKARVEVFWDD